MVLKSMHGLLEQKSHSLTVNIWFLVTQIT